MSTHARNSTSPKKSLPIYLQPLITPLLLFVVCFFVYNANLRQIGTGDTLPARYQPLILWHDGTLDLDANSRLVAHGYSMIADWNRPAGTDEQITYFEPWAYWMIRTHRHQLASLYPVVTPVLVAPLYLPSVIWLNAQGWEQPQVDWVALLMEKISASFLASVATVLMYLILRRENARWALPLAVVFAFGTNTWMISSQALWQHGTGEFLIALALLLALNQVSPARIALLGAVCVFMAVNRPPDALIAGAIMLFIVWKYRGRSVLWLFAGAIIPLAAFLYYNLSFIGHIAGGYGLLKSSQNVVQPIWLGVAGLLISPTRGLLVFSPFFIFIFVGLVQRLRSPDSKMLAVVLSFAVAAQILLYSLIDWRAGVSWGPRLLTDLLPILIWMLAPAPLVLRPLARGLFVLLMLVSVAVQTIGAFWYTRASDQLIFTGDQTSMSSAWDIHNIPFITELRHPPAFGELHCNAGGSIDRIGDTLFPDNGMLPELEPGAVVKGWALICRRTPAQVVVLIDGVVIGETIDLTTRTDINELMHTTSPSGWRISANTLGVSPGERVLQVAIRHDLRSDVRIILEQRVLVIAQRPIEDAVPLPQEAVSGSDLEAMAQRAVQLLQERQTQDGYWLTTFTSDIRYEAPQQEMNTFLTSTMVDFLSPLSPQHNLDSALQRAREHLAAQIEGNGLVRYHGLPDSPIMGTLGCVITPDADDTALVWRITGSADDPRLQPMLAELSRYRDSRGLYRTWLAPQAQYQCIDPGNDPNPTDIAIQMNVYLMLRELDPPAAQNLCDALQHSFWDGDIWVYYSKAPLLPYLRSAELRQLGCSIQLPTEQLALPAAGQEIWSKAVRLLVDTMTSSPNEEMRQDIRTLLVQIGSNDFAQLRNTPPMLYNNDLTATVRRFYWSEDFGYALWLRLYDAAAIETGNNSEASP